MSEQLLEELQELDSNNNLTGIFEDMMSRFYPKIKNINNRIALDLGFLYIYRQLEDETDKALLVDFWMKNSPNQTVQLPMGQYRYRPAIDFAYLDKIMNGLFIENALEQIQKFEKLSFIESCAILFDLERFYVVPLSEMDVKIIETIRDCIKQDKPYTNEVLSKELNVRSNYISRRIGYLRNNAYFRVTGTVNYPKIGLRLYIVLISSYPEASEEISNYFTSPYTRTIRRCPNQTYDYIVSLTLPKEHEPKLKAYLQNLKDLKIIRDCYFDEVKSISNNLDFSYYYYSKRPSVLSASKPGFFIDWFKERIQSMSTNIRETTDFHKFDFHGNRVNFTKMDLKIMTLYRRDLDSSVRTIAKRLAISWDETSAHIDRTQNLLFPMILLYYMGLNQTAILFFDKITQSNFSSLKNILVRMPQSFAYTFKNGGVIATVDLMNGSHRLNDLICETLPNITNAQFSLASKTSGIFRPIPFKYFSKETNDWFFPDDFFLFKEFD